QGERNGHGGRDGPRDARGSSCAIDHRHRGRRAGLPFALHGDGRSRCRGARDRVRLLVAGDGGPASGWGAGRHSDRHGPGGRPLRGRDRRHADATLLRLPGRRIRMTNKRDENDLLKAGKLQSDPLHGADRAALRVVQPGEEHRTDLPSSIESERALLAALLWAGKNQPDMLRIGAVRDILDDGGVFYRWQHGRIYGAMIACAESKQEHDPVAVHAQIASSGQSMGGREALEKLVDIASTVSERQARVYAQAIRDSWVRRKIIADAEQVAREARDPKVSTVDLIDRSKAVYAAAAERASINGSSVSLRESAESLFRRLQAATQDWCPTGFVDLDGLLNGGLRPREVIVLAARTSVGKSMLACQIAERIVTDDPSRGVLY